MKKSERKSTQMAGFTIVELLTVMAVIAILIGLLVPALSLVNDTAKDLQQRAQFHAIEVGLEIFKKEMGVYPESIDSQYKTDSTGTSLGLDAYCGANKLAEAMVGFDLLGFHPKSEFTADGLDLGGTNVYTNALDEREERFIDIEKANAYELSAIYGTTTVALNGANYVLCDSFSKRRPDSGLKIGSPILYFRANTRFKIQDSQTDSPDDADTIVDNDDVYTYLDNQELVALGSAETGDPHELNAATFDSATDGVIINDQVSTAMVPYNAQSFILMSAGKDGIFGNADDIYNFEKTK